MAFNDFSPRLGFTYDVTGDGRTLARANYARYYGQVGNGGVAATVNPVGSTTLRYPWTDANSNQVADVGEIALSANPIAASTNWSAANPANTVSANSVDPNLKNDTTDEFIVGLDREVGKGFAVGANYIWRQLRQLRVERPRRASPPPTGSQTTFTPTAALPGRRRPANRARRNCPPITYFQPTFQQPTVVQLTNVPGLQPGVQRLRADRRASGCRTAG